MKITEVLTDICRLTRAKAIRNGKYTYAATGQVVVRVRTDGGVEGVGFSHAQPGPDLALFEAARALSQEAVGLDVFDVERLWDRMFQPKIYGRRGLATRAMSAIDIAVWDAIGKTTGVSLHKLLGGFADRVPVYVAGGYYVEGKGMEGLAEELRTKVQAGARCVKMKIGGAPMSEDVERVRVAREAVGPDVGLMIDANNAYTVVDAIRFARKVEKFEPMPVASGENEQTRYGFRDLVASHGTDILQADATIMGGVTEWRHVASLASAHGILMAPHGSSALHVHLVAAVSNGMIVEHGITEGKTERLLESDIKLAADGTISPPTGPGHGIKLNEGVLKKHALKPA